MTECAASPGLQPTPSPEDHIQALTRLIASHQGVKRVILFGSRARGHAGPRSDIDLAVEGDERLNWTGLWLAVEDYPTLLKIDLVELNGTKGEFGEAILRSGKVLYEAA